MPRRSAQSARQRTIVASGATLSVEGGITTAEAITLDGSGVSGVGALTGTGNSTVTGAITLGTGTPTVGVAAAPDTLTLAGVVGGTSLTKVGAGTLSLTTANTYSGVTNVNEGVLSVSGGAAITDTSAVTVAFGALLNLQASETIGSLAGDTPATGGTVQLNVNTITTGGDDSDTTFAGLITGTGGLIKAGAGSFTLGGNNTYDGLTQINTGTLAAAHATALGSTAGSTNVASGANLTIANAAVGAEVVTLNGGTALTGVGTASLAGAVLLNAVSTITADLSDTLTLSGVIGGAFGLTKAGTGTLVLSNTASTYTGNTVIAAGILAAAASGSLGDPTLGTNTLLFNGPGATLRADGIINSSATRNVTLDSAGIIDTNGNSVTIAGVIDGSGGLTKNGAGILTLSNACSYGGLTSMNAGTLLVNGSIALSATVVNSAATLGGTNGTLGALSVASGGTLSPGASAGILTATGGHVHRRRELQRRDRRHDRRCRLRPACCRRFGRARGRNARRLAARQPGGRHRIHDHRQDLARRGVGDFRWHRQRLNGYHRRPGVPDRLCGRRRQRRHAHPRRAEDLRHRSDRSVLADVNTTTIAGPNFTSPSQSVVRDQVLNGDINGTVNADVTVTASGSSVSTSKAGGAINFVNNGAIVVDNAGANGNRRAFPERKRRRCSYSGTGTISNDADTPDSAGLSIASSGGIGGTNLIEVAGSITGPAASLQPTARRRSRIRHGDRYGR